MFEGFCSEITSAITRMFICHTKQNRIKIKEQWYISDFTKEGGGTNCKAAHFVMDGRRRTTADAGHDIRQNAIWRFA